MTAANEPAGLSGGNLLSLEEIPLAGVERILEVARSLKANGHGRPLEGRSASLVFLNPSLRTRTSFEIGMARLGGHAVVLSPGSDSWALEDGEGVVMDGSKAEHVKEAAGVLGAMSDLIGIRAFPGMKSFAEDSRETAVRAFAEHAGVPVVNMESALSHPLQALADRMTLTEHLGDLAGRRLLITWAYHPKPLPIAVPRSALLAACRAGMDVTLARPQGFDLPGEAMDTAKSLAQESGGRLTVTNDQEGAYSGAEAVYAKSWASPEFYGRFPEEAALREGARDWRVTMERMERTAEGAPFLHCLPVRRNVVVDDAVLDSDRSAVIGQAENRLWTVMATALELLGVAS